MASYFALRPRDQRMSPVPHVGVLFGVCVSFVIVTLSLPVSTMNGNITATIDNVVHDYVSLVLSISIPLFIL